MSLLPVENYYFDRPLVLLQSDDWGRVGLRDQHGLEELEAAGVTLGERPYDFYTLETAEDLTALMDTLQRHHDAVGRHPCLQMNFITGNLDLARMAADAFQKVHFLPLSEGLPAKWNRPGLVEAYHEGIVQSLFYPALHGTTHFCRQAVERNLQKGGERGDLLRTLWNAGTPYIHWRMPWIGYEYWDPEKTEDERFLSSKAQLELVGQAVGSLAKVFSTLPRSACAPGYRADDNTSRAWAQHGIRVAQNGPGVLIPPHFDRHGVLQLCRTVEFEPATNPSCSVEVCVSQAEACFQRGLPAILSLHSINFHSTVRDFRSRTLQMLDEFLSTLECRHADLLYLHDEDLYEIVSSGTYRGAEGKARVNVSRKKHPKGQAA